jgi:septal ring factor EnvC (AmiA/AmiB activator)
MKSLKLASAFLLAAGAAAVASLSSTAVAQYPGGYGAGQPTGPNPQLVEARKAIQAAEKEVTKIRADMQKLKLRVQSKFETKDEWEAAQKELKAAEAANEVAKKKAMAKLIARPDYKAAKDKQAKADQQVAALQAQGDKANVKQLEAAQQARIDAGLSIRKLETESMDNDPGVADAKEKLANAKKSWEALQDEVKQALDQDADYQAADQQLKEAQANVDQMRQQMRAQQAQEAAARRQAAEAERASRRTSGGGGGGGRGGYGR